MPLCTGCHGDFPAHPETDLGPTHQYLLSSPACWARYGTILAREYSNPPLMRLHRLTVDTYAVQHPGIHVPAARRSLGLHLARLHLLLERHWPIERANHAALALTTLKDACEWLDPPSMAATLTVLNLPDTTEPAPHEAALQAWATSVWNAWSPHHATVRRWCAPL